MGGFLFYWWWRTNTKEDILRIASDTPKWLVVFPCCLYTHRPVLFLPIDVNSGFINPGWLIVGGTPTNHLLLTWYPHLINSLRIIFRSGITTVLIHIPIKSPSNVRSFPRSQYTHTKKWLSCFSSWHSPIKWLQWSQNISIERLMKNTWERCFLPDVFEFVLR